MSPRPGATARRMSRAVPRGAAVVGFARMVFRVARSTARLAFAAVRLFVRGLLALARGLWWIFVFRPYEIVYTLCHRIYGLWRHGYGTFILLILRRLWFFPFTFVEMVYYALCRVRDVARGDTYAHVALYRGGRSPHTIRNFFIFQNRLVADPAVAEKQQVEVALVLDGSYHDTSDLFSVFLLNPYGKDFHVYTSEDVLRENLAFFVPAAKREAYRKGADWLIDLDALTERELTDYFLNGDASNLRLPGPALRTAWNFVKTLTLGFSVAPISLSNSAGKDLSATVREWDEFFVEVASLYPDVVFVLLNPATYWDRTTYRAHGNLVLASQFGLDFSEKIALVHQADMYLGAYDAYAAAVVGTNVPALVMRPEANSRRAPSVGDGARPRSLTPRSHQRLLLDDVTPRQFLGEFRSFREALGARPSEAGAGRKGAVRA